jgi:TM2 domain-containing membrane protein YozV
MLAAAFAIASLGVSILERFPPYQALPLAGAAVVVVLVPSAVLILGPSDDELEARRDSLAYELETLPEPAGAPVPTRPRPPAVVPASPYPAKPQEVQCPYCLGTGYAAALKCRHCGEFLDQRLQREREERQVALTPRATPIVMPAMPLWSPGVAAVLSLVIPGAGQMYKGQVINGLAWLFLTCLGYFMCCVLPGVVLHLCCILGAASGDPYRR